MADDNASPSPSSDSPLQHHRDAVKSSVLLAALRGKGSQKKKIEVLRALRRLLSQSKVPPVDAAIKAGAVPLLVQYLSFGSPDEQLLEAASCLTNIVAGEPEETKSLLPALPLLIAHLGEKSSVLVTEQCAWAIGNVAGEGAELRSKLLAQGALRPLTHLMLSNKDSTARTSAWALSNLIKGPDPKAAIELISIDGVLNAIIRNLEKAYDEELATEVAWVVVYLSALSERAISLIVRSSVPQLLIGRLLSSNNLQLLIPVLRGLGNLVASDGYMVDSVLIVGNIITGKLMILFRPYHVCDDWMMSIYELTVYCLFGEYFSFANCLY
ncbi:hypothetical protein ABZP36_028146 [Zizania latifolia]